MNPMGVVVQGAGGLKLVVLTALLAGLAARWGAPVAARMRPGLARWGVSLLAGLALLGTASLGLALAGLFRPGVVVALWVLPVVAGWRLFPDLCPGATRDLRELAPLVWLALPALAPAIVSLPCPEYEQDAYIYHLAAPEQFLRAGRILTDLVPHTFPFPLPVEMTFAVALVLGDDRLAKGLVLAAFLAACAVFAGRAARREQHRAVWLGPVLAVAAGWALFLMTRAKSDVPAAALLVAGALLGRPRATPLSAALMGAAIAAKLTCAPVALAWIAFHPAARGQASAVLPCLVLPVAPWCLNAFLATGHPLFSMTGGTWPVPGWGAANAAAFSAYTAGLAAPGTGHLAGLPAAWLRILGRGDALAAVVPVVLLFVGVRGVRASARTPAALSGAAAILLGEFLVLGILRVPRYLLPATMLTGFLAAEAMTLRGRPGTWAVALLAAWGFIRAAAAPGLPWRHHETPTAYPEAIAAAARENPRRLLSVGEARTYRLPGRVVYGGAYGETPIAWRIARESRDLREIRARYRQLGCSWMVYNCVTAEYTARYQRPFPWDDRMLDLHSLFARTCLVPVFTTRHDDLTDGRLVLYRIDLLRPRPPDPAVFYLPGAEVVYYDALVARAGAKLGWAVSLLDGPARRHPEVRLYVAQIATTVALSGNSRNAYALLAPLVREGWRNSITLPVFALAAFNLGKRAEAREAAEESLRVTTRDADRLRAMLTEIEKGP